MQVLRIVPNVASDDFAASRDFYTSMFDLEVSVEMDWYLQLMSPSDRTLNMGVVEPTSELLGGASDPSGPAGVVVTIHVDEVDEARARAEDLGAEIVMDLRDEPHGQRHFLMRDPNGLLLNVMSAIDPAPG